MATKKADAPEFTVAELVENSYALCETPRHVAAGAMVAAGKAENDLMTVDAFNAAITGFLNRPIS